MTRPAFPYLSIVLAWPGPADDVDAEHLAAALERHHDRLSEAQVPHEIVFVRWRPAASEPWPLRDLVRDAPAAMQERLRVYDVDPGYHDAFSQDPRVSFHEFIARNAGIRRATGSYVLSTSVDACLDDSLLSLLATRALRPMLLYRTVGAAGGDVLLLDRFSWHQLRGFNEIYRVDTGELDANFCAHARAAGIRPVEIEPAVRRLSQGDDDSSATASAAATGWQHRLSYRNPANWGIGDAPTVQRGPGEFSLEFAHAAVPPLVALGAITVGER